ncbi:hypothetical protein ACOSQ4_019171 [Xanthoceras sorbifolium]
MRGGMWGWAGWRGWCVALIPWTRKLKLSIKGPNNDIILSSPSTAQEQRRASVSLSFSLFSGLKSSGEIELKKLQFPAANFFLHVPKGEAYV